MSSILVMLLFGLAPSLMAAIDGDADTSEASNSEDSSETPPEEAAEVSAQALIDLMGDADDDMLYGTTEGDDIQGLSGDDTLTALAGDDLVDGGAGADELRGNMGDDTVLGSAGDDRLNGNEDNDLLDGGTGADRLDGGTENDTLFGGEGVDTLDGSGGDDVLNGNVEDAGSDGFADVLDGGAGDDVLHLGDADEATGGAGADLFNVLADVTGQVTITDFDANADTLTIEAEEGEELGITDQQVVPSGLIITLSNGVSITLAGHSAEVDPSIIEMVAAA